MKQPRGFRDKIVKDSVFHYDSVFVKQTADTVFFERYRYLYKDKIIRDSVFIQDTIRVPYPVEVIKQVKTPLNLLRNKINECIFASCNTKISSVTNQRNFGA
jgi:hypothetical protein